MTATATPAPAPAPEIELAANEQSTPVRVAPPAPKKCSLCFSGEKHGETVAGTKCSVCGHAHGETVRRAGRDRKVVVRHSLPVEREGGFNAQSRWANPSAQWVAPAICDDCAWDARRAAHKADVRPPKMFDLAANLAEATARDARDVEFRAKREAERAAEEARRQKIVAKREAERVAEEARLENIRLMVLKGARVSSSDGKRERGDRRGGNNGQRRGERSDHRTSERKGLGTDSRGNPKVGNRSYVTPDDVAAEEPEPKTPWEQWNAGQEDGFRAAKARGHVGGA